MLGRTRPVAMPPAEGHANRVAARTAALGAAGAGVRAALQSIARQGPEAADAVRLLALAVGSRWPTPTAGLGRARLGWRLRSPTNCERCGPRSTLSI